jgi:hypothetical protein
MRLPTSGAQRVQELQGQAPGGLLDRTAELGVIKAAVSSATGETEPQEALSGW